MLRDPRELRWPCFVVLLSLGCEKPHESGPTPAPSASAPSVDGKAEFAEVACKSITLSGTKERSRVEQVRDAVRWVARTAKHPTIHKWFDAASRPGIAIQAYAEFVTDAAKEVGANVRPCTLLETLAKLPQGPVVTIEGEKVLFDYKAVDTLVDATAAKASGKPVAMPGLLAEMKFAAKRWAETHPSSETLPGIFELEAPTDLDAFYVKCIAHTATTAGYGKLQPYRP